MLTRAASRFVCLVLAIDLMVSPLAAQQSSGSSGTTPTTPAPPSAPASAYSPLGDYVPCIFSEDVEFPMRAQEAPPKAQKKMTPDEAEALLNKVDLIIQTELDKFNSTPDFARAFQSAYYSESLKPGVLYAITPDQAIAKIEAVLGRAAIFAKNTSNTAGKSVRTPTTDEVSDAKHNVANSLEQKVTEEVSKVEKENKDHSKTTTTDDLVKAGKDAISNAADLNLATDYKNDVLAHYDRYTEIEKSRYIKLDKLDLYNIVQDAAQKAAGYPFAASAQRDSLDLADLINRISTVTEQTAIPVPAKPFQAPTDVSCSVAVMSWKETRDIFGRRVANTFVAIQVTLRNLNTKNEFLVHDIQVAVDTGMTQDYFGRFQAGRDKLLVRAVAQRGQSDDRRNVVLNSLATVGAIAASASLVSGTSAFKDAVAVFQGAFLTGFANIFPDHTVDQLNHINDLVFSASNTNKVVVPVQGSVPLVTFISERPIEELPFAWCGHPAAGWMKRWTGRGTEQNCNFNGGTHDPGYSTPYRFTKSGERKPGDKQAKDNPPKVANPSENDQAANPAYNGDYPQGPNVDQRMDDKGYLLPIKDGLPPWNDLQYKDWRGAAVRMLQEHTFVVVGGVHIQEIVTQPKVTNLSCQNLTTGQLDLSQVQDGVVSCTATGTGLNLVSAAMLEKGTGKIAGTIKPATDGNSATITFKPEDLCNSEGSYSLFLTYKSDAQKTPTDIDSGESALLGKQPTVTSVSFASPTLTINGACLDQLSSVSLAPSVANNPTVPGGAPAAATDTKSATSTFPIAAAAAASGSPPALRTGAAYYLTYTLKVQPSNQIKKQSLTVTP
jgi:hypothetical protein